MRSLSCCVNPITFKRSDSHVVHVISVHYLFSISCFISIPCFSRSSLWANVQSTGSEGVSAEGVFSRSARACSGWLKRNTWFLPMMIRFPGTKQKQGKEAIFEMYSIYVNDLTFSNAKRQHLESYKNINPTAIASAFKQKFRNYRAAHTSHVISTEPHSSPVSPERS